MAEQLLAPRWAERVRRDVVRREPLRALPDGARIAILSDAHGNLGALEAAAADVERLRADLVLVGGDMTQGGCRPDGVVDFLTARGWLVVVGNSDALLLDLHEGLITLPERFTWAGMAAHWSLEQLGPKRIEAMRAWPAALRYELPGGRSLTLVHATTWSLEDIIWADTEDAPRERMLREADSDLVVYGHIHNAYHRALGEGLVVSVGAVSGSNDEDTRPAYTLLEVTPDGLTLEVRRVAWDVGAEREAIRASGMPDQERVLSLIARPGPLPVRSPSGPGAAVHLPWAGTAGGAPL